VSSASIYAEHACFVPIRPVLSSGVCPRLLVFRPDILIFRSVSIALYPVPLFCFLHLVEQFTGGPSTLERNHPQPPRFPRPSAQLVLLHQAELNQLAQGRVTARFGSWGRPPWPRTWLPSHSGVGTIPSVLRSWRRPVGIWFPGFYVVTLFAVRL